MVRKAMGENPAKAVLNRNPHNRNGLLQPKHKCRIPAVRAMRFRGRVSIILKKIDQPQFNALPVLTANSFDESGAI